MNDAVERSAELLAPVATAFRRRLAEYGNQPHGVFWRTRDGQVMRFDILLGILKAADVEAGTTTINDFGCGYGALFAHILDEPFMKGGRYTGYDLTEEMIIAAKRAHRDPRATFVHGSVATREADYTIVSGTYNMRIDADAEEWLALIQSSLRQLWPKTRKGLAFNMLSIYDRHHQGDLYYADPSVFFDFCIRGLSPNVTLLHDYPLKEWTIYVRR